MQSRDRDRDSHEENFLTELDQLINKRRHDVHVIVGRERGGVCAE